MPSTRAKLHDIRVIMATWVLKSCLAFVLSMASAVAVAQRPQYDIEVKLDTASHTLEGTIHITYTNRSAQPLAKLGVHLYPNAYANNNTALAKQLARNGSSAFANAPNTARGEISSLKFMADEKELELSYDPVHREIAWVGLTAPLQPGAAVTISTPFVVRIPKSFSRLGRTDDGAYQITQWYPHIGVFDDEGWHMMPYLDHGEYFNDFADYRVSITLPGGYKVAATGHVYDISGANNHTTWVWKAENVIDFAWFASPHFALQTFSMESREKDVMVNIYTDTLLDKYWTNVPEYARRAIGHYTDWLGTYPYEQVSVVATPYSAAGFMEYPMVAQISYTDDTAFLQTAIAHEIGHTWLYGALANNERTHAWMDEGLNTFLEKRYAETYLPGYDPLAISPEVSNRRSMSQDDAWQHLTRFSNKLQPPNSAPDLQRINQYVLGAYTLPAQGLDLMMAQVGREMIRDMMRMYYEDHKLQHVSPDDMRSSFESICDCNLGWFFKDWMDHSHAVDYRMVEWDRDAQELVMENHGHPGIPLQVSAYSDGQFIDKFFVDGFAGQQIIRLPKLTDEVRLYEDVPAINKQWWNRVEPRPFLPYLTLFPKIGSYYKPSVNVTPWAATNQSDGPMLGVVFTSGLLPQPKLKWIVAPFYGFESKSIRGYGEARYINDMRGVFDKLLISLSTEYFGYEVDTHYYYRSQYLRLSPEIGLRLTPTDKYSLKTQWLKYRLVNLQQFYGIGTNYELGTFRRDKRDYSVHELAYTFRSDYGLRPMQAEANIQQGKGFVRINATYKQHFTGRDKQRGVWVRGYAGWLPMFDGPEAAVHLDIHGYASHGFYANDYMFDHWLGGRNAGDGIYAHQVYPRDAHLKTLATHGIGQEWMLGGGASFALPFKWLHLYMDGAYYPNAIRQETMLSYSGGVALVLAKDVFEIYLPLLESRDIRESLSYVVRDRWFERVSFQFNFKMANPLDLADRLSLRY